MTRRPLCIPFLLLLSLVTACGSTVQTAGPGGTSTLAQGDPSLGDGLGGGSDGLGSGETDGLPSGIGSSAGDPGTAGADNDGPGAPGTAGAGGGTATAVDGSSTADQGGAPVRAGVSSAPGVTDTEIKVGLSYGVNGRAAAAAFGATGEGAGGGDGRRMWDVMLKSVNDAGGLLGRKLVPVYHEFDSASAEPFAAQEQAACETWTVDNKVFWASEAPTRRNLTACLHKAGVSQSSATPTDASTAVYRDHPNLIEAGTLQMDRITAALPGQLQAQGWFDQWDTTRGAAGGVLPTKVGIVSFDDTDTKNAVNRVLVPALKRVVGTDPVVVQVATPQSPSDNAATITAIQSATLRFKQMNVTHVLPFETQGAGIGVFVAQGADGQRYFPRYGLTSGNATQLYVDQGLWPRNQLNGAMGFGWVPLLDLTNRDNPDNGENSNDARRRCVKLMTDNGIDVSSAIIKRQAIMYCSTIELLAAALEAGGPTISRDSFREGAHRLGTSFEAGLTFATRYAPDRHDGAAQIRALPYQPDCGCFRYTGPRITLP